MIVGEKPSDIQAQIDFYKSHHDVVHLVYCEDGCGELLAVELLGNLEGMQTDNRGMAVVPVSNKLLSHRVRLDETDDGHQMVGYQCECGNDTRLGKIEQGHVPTGQTMGQVAWTPFQRHQAKLAIQASGKKVKVKVKNNKRHLESFSVERVK